MYPKGGERLTQINCYIIKFEKEQNVSHIKAEIYTYTQPVESLGHINMGYTQYYTSYF